MDVGLFWGFVVIALILILLPFFMGGQKWAIVSLFGVMFALLVASSLAADGSITVAYQGSGAAITNPDNLPMTVLMFISLAGFFVTIAKGLDKI